MNITDFYNRVEALETRLADRGFFEPDATCYIRFCGKLVYLRVEAKTHADPTLAKIVRSESIEVFKEEDLEAAFAKLEAWIDEQVTPEERRKQDYVRSMASMIEEGRSLGLPIVADLEATMKRLSENILTNEAA